MHIIESGSYSVIIAPLSNGMLSKMLKSSEYKKAKKFVLVDENSLKYCFPKVVDAIPELRDAELIEIDSGEDNKNIEICTQLWQALQDLGADRNAVLINLGGGVISDMGGFIASTYKRGIRFINIPTTLLAQVDASIGGKVGVDLGGLKNQIGLFSYPQAVFVDADFIRTLPKREVLSGFAEIIKHSLIRDASYFQELKGISWDKIDQLGELIPKSIQIKNEIVLSDPLESNSRKLLNFGHTIGHAVESLSFESDRKLLSHGEAVAIGMIAETWLSYRHRKLSESDFLVITGYISSLYPFWKFDSIDFHRLIELMKHDKKNNSESINFTLLDGIGNGVINCTCNAEEIKEALRFYLTTEHNEI